MKTTHQEYLQKRKLDAEALLRQMLDGELGILIGCRRILGLLHDFQEQIDRDDYLVFVAVDSETDDLPIGPERQYWAPDALAQKDKIAAEYEERCRDDVLTAARNVLKKLAMYNVTL